MALSPGDLIVDNYGREGIVLWRDKTPRKKWLSIQEDERVKTIRTKQWWLVMPLMSGGSVIVPEPLVSFIRRATTEDAAGVVALNEASYVTLVRLFPDLTTV